MSLTLLGSGRTWSGSGRWVGQLDQAVAYRSAMSTLSADEKARLASAAGLVVTSSHASSSYG